MSNINHTKKNKPFEGRRVYLHLKHVSHMKQRELKLDLERLGAIVDEFFSNEVHCVISDHPATPVGRCGQIENSLINQETNCDDSAKQPEVSMSRGQSLLNIAKQKEVDTRFVYGHASDANTTLFNLPPKLSPCTPMLAGNAHLDSVLEACKRFHIVVVHLRQISAFLQKKNLFGKSVPVNVLGTKENDQGVRQVHHNRRRKFVKEFLKIEDVRCLYKPAFITFSKWPEFTEEDSTTAFGRSRLTKDGQKESKKANSSPSKRVTAPTPQPRQMFCELCGIKFVSLSKHLQTTQHRDYLSEEKNYSTLCRMIGTLPTPEALVAKMIATTSSSSSGVTSSLSPEKHNEIMSSLYDGGGVNQSGTLRNKPLPVRNFGDFVSPVVRVRTHDASQMGNLVDRGSFVAAVADVRRVRVAVASPAKSHLQPGNEALKRRLQLTAERRLRSDGDTILHRAPEEEAPCKRFATSTGTPIKVEAPFLGSKSPLTSGSRVPPSCDTPDKRLFLWSQRTASAASYSCNDVDLRDVDFGGPFYDITPNTTRRDSYRTLTLENLPDMPHSDANAATKKNVDGSIVRDDVDILNNDPLAEVMFTPPSCDEDFNYVLDSTIYDTSAAFKETSVGVPAVTSNESNGNG